MCVAMVIIHTKTLDKKPVDNVTSTESLQLVRRQIFSIVRFRNRAEIIIEVKKAFLFCNLSYLAAERLLDMS